MRVAKNTMVRIAHNVNALRKALDIKNTNSSPRTNRADVMTFDTGNT